MNRLALIALLASCCIVQVSSFAEWMTKEYCDRQLREGEVIMNARAEASSSLYIQVFRQNSERNFAIELNVVNDTFVPRETVMLKLSDAPGVQGDKVSVFEAVFETSAGEFAKGGCARKQRRAGSNVVLQVSY